MKTKINFPPLLIVVITVFFSHMASAKQEARFTYHENDGVFVYYETKKEDMYRQLLPKEFDMPDRLYIYTFISDFYKMDSATDPYKEASIFLLAKYKGREVWHCIFMPVTSETSRIAGIRRLGLPKTIVDIKFIRNSPVYSGTATVGGGLTMSLSISTQDYEMSKQEEDLIRELSTLPKLNLLNGEIIEMSGGRRNSLIDLAQRFPNKLILKPGKVSLEFNSNNASNHALDLTPVRILGGYYLLNKITFRLRRK